MGGVWCVVLVMGGGGGCPHPPTSLSPTSLSPTPPPPSPHTHPHPQEVRPDGGFWLLLGDPSHLANAAQADGRTISPFRLLCGLMVPLYAGRWVCRGVCGWGGGGGEGQWEGGRRQSAGAPAFARVAERARACPTATNHPHKKIACASWLTLDA